jgi:Fe-S cluster assembly protein SufD
MEPTTIRKDLLAQLTEAFAAREKDVHPARRKAMDILIEKGLPTTKSEEYRFTPVVKTLEHKFNTSPVSATTVHEIPQLIPGLDTNTIVFMNGRYSAEHSRIIDSNLLVQRGTATTAGADQDPFDLLNLAFGDDHLEIVVAERQQLKHPVAIVYHFSHSSFVFANPRWSLKIGAGSTCTVIEYTLAQPGSAYFNNKQSRIEVKENARLDYVMIQQGAREEVAVNNTSVWLSSAAQAFCYTCTLDGKLVRNNLTLVLDGEGIDAHLHGLYFVSGQSLVDNHTVVDHRKANSFSNELYKGVMDENGKAVFNGKIFVRPDAQKTNAFQSNRNILLSETSNIHTKPQLEIWADNVKCSHGCTTGQLDEEALFYLRSRGIPKDAARGLLLTAFAGETLEGIHDETLRMFVEGLILKKLHTTHP